MNGASISFVASFVAIVGMFTVKIVEARTGKKSMLTVASDSTNHLVHDIVARIKYIASFVNKRNAVLLAKFIAYHVISVSHRMYRKIKRTVKTYLDNKPASPINMVLGKGVLKKKGSVSFFLKHIAEENKKREAGQ